MNRLILLLFLIFIISYVFAPNPTPFPRRQNLRKFYRQYDKIGVNCLMLPKIIIFASGLVSSLWFFLLYSCNQVHFITFNTNLTLYKKKSELIVPELMLYLLIVLVWLLLIEYPEDFFFRFLYIIAQIFRY